mgnify:CR=1 FL=1
MGLGDDLMFLGECEKVYKAHGKKIFPMFGKRPLPDHKWSPMYENCEFITRDPAEAGFSMNIKPTEKGKQPHIEDDTDTHQTYREYQPIPFRLRLTKQEQAEVRGIVKTLPEEFCIVNPDYKEDVFKHNKNWGEHRWQELIQRLETPVVRLATDNRHFDGCVNLSVSNVRIAFAITEYAEFVVSCEGGLVHAATGFGTRCVVLFNGLTPAWSLGYESSINIEHEHPMSPCGKKDDCDHCREGWRQLTVDRVLEVCNDLRIS